MLPKKSRGKYIRVSQLRELPLKQVTNFSGSNAEWHVGEPYVITGILLDETNGMDKQIDGTDKNILVFYADTDKDRKHRVVIATDALDNDQKTFISSHCWLNTAEYPTSMCHGDVYISVQREPTGHFITYELDGAVGGEFLKCPEFLTFLSPIPSCACATFSLFFCMRSSSRSDLLGPVGSIPLWPNPCCCDTKS
jgi:hypothetical protein